MPTGGRPRYSALKVDEHLATRLVALSFDSAASPEFTLKADCTVTERAFGWGFAWYPEQSGAALVVKDATSVGDNAMTKLLREWDRFESTTFVAHIRGSARTLTERDTHPFGRSHGGRDWVFAHNGDLSSSQGLEKALPLGHDPVFEPLGRSDSEYVFCWLLNEARAVKARCLADIGGDRLLGWCRTLNELGTANLVLSDGRDLAVYADRGSYNPVHMTRLLPPRVPEVLATPELQIGLEDARERTRTVLVFSTLPLAPEGFEAMAPGQLVVARRGVAIYNSRNEEEANAAGITAPAPAPQAQDELTQRPVTVQAQSMGEAELDRAPGPSPLSRALPSDHHFARPEPGRLLRIRHVTRYEYSKPVERSFHLFRLQPVHDRWQDVLSHDFSISVDGLYRSYDDVFGNAVVTAELEKPFSELVVSSDSVIRVRSGYANNILSPHRRFNIPLVWMPWQRQMMTPYLLPPELPETQLRELSDFAMSFVERQDYDLVETLLDMNATIYRDFSYVSGSTSMATTPFQVYSNRKGVCQDFANLLICMARLLGIPARYRVGYIFTGGKYENEIQSDASHAWAELYLPWTGWRGFDPTNGVLVNNDHVLVACGRNYGDATPTSGTLYRGGGKEALTVDVKVQEVVDPSGSSAAATQATDSVN